MNPAMLLTLCALCLGSTTQPSLQPPIYQRSAGEVAKLLPRWQREHVELPARVVAIARANLGQPYELYLLGEAPFETIDPQPVYCLDRSDCVVFLEHALAMALSDNWPEFLAMLQRIRFADGAIGVRSRNHYTEADWNQNNRWLLREITKEIAPQALVHWTLRVDRAKFFKDRYKLQTDHPVQLLEQSFVPYEHVPAIASQLREGDVVNFVSGRGGNYWVGHVGLVGRDANGNVSLIHSAAPHVREEPIEEYVARATKDAAEKQAEGKATFAGFKFLRLTDDPWASLRAVDGPTAPRVTLPAGSPVSWDEFVRSTLHESAEPPASGR
jgi:hypothetical protein